MLRMARGRAIACGLAAVVASSLAPAPVLAWDAHGHRIITLLALELMGAGDTEPVIPGWLDEPSVRWRIAYQSAEPDRWRGQPTPALRHENNPDHYLDLEDLEPFGLTLRTMPPLRMEYLRVMAAAKAAAPDRFAAYDPSQDPSRDKEWPGFVAHSMLEHYAKLQSSFRTLRLLEIHDGPGRAAQIEQARSNVIYHMGVLSHFVGDSAQPLHTTRHFNGWVGGPEANPNGYTTSTSFHAYIDGGVLKTHAIDLAMLRGACDARREVDAKEPWPDLLSHLERSHAFMVPLYTMQKDGTLDLEAGKTVILERLGDGAAMLAGLYRAAWMSSEPSEGEVARFPDWTPADPVAPEAAPAPPTAPGAAAPGEAQRPAPSTPARND